jgi:hypothetical protein
MSRGRRGGSRRRLPGRWAPLALASAILLLSVEGVSAQSWRLQGAWVAGTVGGPLVGVEMREPLGGEPDLPLPGVEREGPMVMESRDWIFTGMVGAGLNAAPPGGESRVRPLFYGHAGIVYRTGSALISRVGLVGAGYVPDWAVGPAALIEAAGVIDLQAGALRTDPGWRGHVALTVSMAFLCDLVCGR